MMNIPKKLEDIGGQQRNKSPIIYNQPPKNAALVKMTNLLDWMAFDTCLVR